MPKKHNSAIPMPVRVLAGVLGIVMLFFGFFGFLCSIGRGMHYQTGIFYEQKPLNDINGIAVDSTGMIYIGESESSCIQVYDPNGKFQYGFYFPTGGSGWFTFGIDSDDHIHIVTARTDSHYIFKNGELVTKEELTDYDMQTALEAEYSMTNGSRFKQGVKSYHVIPFHWLEITDIKSGSVSSLDLQSPLWPLPISDFWMIAAMGGAMVFFGIADSIIPGGLFHCGCRNKKRAFRARDNFIIITNQTVDETRLILSGLTQPKYPGIFASRNSQKAFWGQVMNNAFKISPILNYYNSFAPILMGEISETETETVLSIHARPHTFVTVFTTMWMVFCGLLSLICVIEIIMNRFQSMLLIPFITLAFGYGVFHISFWHEEEKARQFLEKALTSEPGPKK